LILIGTVLAMALMGSYTLAYPNGAQVITEGRRWRDR
jgi:hypothetical protein